MNKLTAIVLTITVLSFLLSACALGGENIVSSSDVISDADSEIEDNSSDYIKSDAPAMSDKLPVESENISDNEKNSVSVVVLGDSIARGYGLSDVESRRFSSVLEKKLETIYSRVEMTNYGVDGQTGKELLDWLSKTPPNELTDCDYVIISIGGNNILQSLSSLSSSLGDFKDIDSSVFKDYFLYLFAPDEETRKKYAYSCETINEVFKRANAVFESDDFEKLIKTAGDSLSEEIPLIIAEVKKHNPNAVVFIQTIYNPYHNVTISLSGVDETLDMSYYGDKAVSRLNEPIKSLAKENGYEVVAVYEVFKSAKQTLINAGFDVSSTRFSVDPHPNAMGHQYIAELYFNVIKQKNVTEGQND